MSAYQFQREFTVQEEFSYKGREQLHSGQEGLCTVSEARLPIGN